MAGPGITRSDPRWPALFVANFAVGGTFSSRINTVLREQKGVTYGASSSLDTARGAGLVTVSTAVRTDATAEASPTSSRSCQASAGGSITAEEVATGVRAATESAALGFERADCGRGQGRVAAGARASAGPRRRQPRTIRAVTAEAANAAYCAIVRPEALTFVVVGDAATVESRCEWGYADLRSHADP